MTSVAWTVAAAALLVGSLAAARRPSGDGPHPGWWPFAGLCAVVGALAVVIVLQGRGLALATVIGAADVLLLGGYAATPPLWITFIFEYTGQGPAITAERAAGLAALWSLTTASTVLTWLVAQGTLALGAIGQLAAVASFFLLIAVFSLGLLGTFVIARAALTYDDLPTRRAGLLVAAGAGITFLPITVGTGQALAIPADTLQLGHLAVIGGCLGMARTGEGVFRASAPAGHLARETVVETMESAVLVVDSADRILDANAAAASAFGVDRTHPRQYTLEDTTGISVDTSLGEPVAVRTDDGRRQFDVHRHALTDAGGTAVGYVYRFRDVTDEITHEQRLQVLNRVLRHNLRNELDAVRGFAEPVREGDLPAAETDRLLERIEALARDLVDLGATMERSDRLLAGTTLDREQCDFGAIARDVADRVLSSDVTAGVAPADLTVETPPGDVVVQTDRAIVRLLLTELVQNAVEHADRESPTVDIVVEDAPGGASVAVCDDGPGIPDHELAVVRAGEESPERHGSGLGLWLVHWGASRLGGTVSVANREPQGTEVVVRIPDLDA